MAALQTSRNAHNLACMRPGVIRGCETTSINHAGRKGAHVKTEKVGQRIKTIMGNKGLSLAELEQRTGLKAELIRLVEEEDVYPSLGPLLKIARALGVRL